MIRHLILMALTTFAAAVTAQTTQPATAPSTQSAKTQQQLEEDFANMLSGATLEGSFTTTGGGDAQKLSSDSYILGTVRKLSGNTWLLPAKIGHGDLTVPLPLPIEWAGDTPVIVVDNLTIPGMGTFSARVMFFAGHYCGYWRHDERGGHLFGVVKRGT